MSQILVIKEYKEVERQIVLDIFKANTPKYFAFEEEEAFCNYLDKERERFYVLSLDGTIVGCGGINFIDNDSFAKISWDMFHPAYQGQALGTHLMKFRISILKSMENIKKIVVRTSQLAYQFYEKQGFELKEIKKDYWAKGFDMYYMEQSI